MMTTGDGAGRAPQTSSSANREVRQTLLLPLLLEQFDPLDRERAITVLDVGSGVPETVEFFSRYRCRLHFAGLIDAPELQAAMDDEDAAVRLQETFSELLALPPGTTIDVCLIWDFLNYLPVPALRAFSAALAPYLSADTRGHGFGAFKATAPAMARRTPDLALQYGVAAVDRLVVRGRPGGAAAGYGHSRAVLSEAFTCLDIARGTLLREGGMELLFERR